jgi:Ribonuclease G/E
MSGRASLLTAIAVTPIACLMGYYIMSVPIANFYAQNTSKEKSTLRVPGEHSSLAPLERRLIAIQKERNATKETRAKNIIASLFADRNAGRITNEQLDQAVRDDSEREAEYLYRAAEQLADQAQLSKIEKLLLSARVPLLMDAAKEK